MAKENAKCGSKVAPKKTWKTPNIESFAVAKITENLTSSTQDGNVSSGVS